MTYKELYDKALWDLEHNNMTLGEFEEVTEPLNKEISKEEQTDGDLISKSVFDQIKWERDVAISQLHDLGYELGEKPRTDGDLISRQAVIDGLARIAKAKAKSDAQQALMGRSMFFVGKLPSSEKTAEWIKQKTGDELFPEEIVCSKCYHSNSHLDFDEHNNPIGKVFFTSKYCPNCGADMRKESEEEE